MKLSPHEKMKNEVISQRRETMTYDATTTQRKISAFLARKAEQHPDVFEDAQEQAVSEPRIINLVYA